MVINSELSEKDVLHYGEYKYAKKAIIAWAILSFLMGAIPLIVFFGGGLIKYKKRFAWYIALFVIAIAILGVSGGIYTHYANANVNMNEQDLAELLNMLFIVLVSAASVSGLVMIFAFVSIVVLTKSNPYMNLIEKEVEESEGKESKEEFVKGLTFLSQQRKVDEFIVEVCAAHNRYEKRKAYIIDDRQFKAKLKEAITAIENAGGRHEAERFNEQSKELFNTYDFEALDALFGTVQSIVAELNNRASVASESGAKTVIDSNSTLANMEYIKPKTSKKTRNGIMIAMILIYGLLLVSGILLSTIPALSNTLSDIGICQEIAAHAYAITIGVMFVALTPSIGYYFVLLAPVKLDKKSKVILSAVSIMLSVIMTVVFFVIINYATIEEFSVPVKKFFEGNDFWFIPVSLIMAQLGLIICYAMLLFKIRPDKIKDVKPKKEGDKFSQLILYMLRLLSYALLKTIKAALKFKERHPEIFIILATLLLTWFAFFTSFIVSIIVIAAFVLMLTMIFSGLVEYSYSGAPSRTTSNDRVTIVDQRGGRVELRKSSFETCGDWNKSVYYDSYNHKWYGDGVDFQCDNGDTGRIDY